MLPSSVHRETDISYSAFPPDSWPTVKKVIAAILLSLSLVIPAHAADSVSDIFTKVLRSLVTVSYEASDDKTHYCTGVVVDAPKGWALTAVHCVELGKDIYVDEALSSIIKVNENFALVSVPKMDKPPLALGKSVPVMGSSVISSGYAYSIPGMTVLSRVIANRQGEDFGLDGPLIPGMSGGPVVDQEGKLIGINQASTEALGLACGIGEIRSFLKSVK